MYSGGELGIRMCSEGELGIRTICPVPSSIHRPLGPSTPSEDIVFRRGLIYTNPPWAREFWIGPLTIVLASDWVTLKYQHNVTILGLNEPEYT